MAGGKIIETWRNIPGWEAFFQVSDLGRVRALERKFYRRHNKTEKLVKYTYQARAVRQWICIGTGYPMVNLQANGRTKAKSVHSAVLEAFVGPRPSVHHVSCHNDGSRTNNFLSNLRWDTYKGNEADKLKHGTRLCGERNHRAKLTEHDVLSIRASGARQQELANRYGVSQVKISQIKLRKCWRHI